MAGNVRSKEIIRGKLLYYLALIYPQEATLALLQGELDIFGYPVPIDEMLFHLAYLEEKGFVSVEKKRGLNSSREVTLARATAKGIDYYDGRIPADEGVYLEPRA